MRNRNNVAMLIAVWFVGCPWPLLGQGIHHESALTAIYMELSGSRTADGRDTKPPKCGTAMIAAILSQWDQLPMQKREEFTEIMQRPQLQKSRTTASGLFRIHYDTTGTSQPALLNGNQPIPNSYEAYIDSVASIFDYCWRYEVDTLGFDQPPSDGADGGGAEYDVYVSNLSAGLFGETDWDNTQPLNSGLPQRFASFIQIDNDFLGYRTSGINALRVTAAHEFHHAIQIGASGIWTLRDQYFNELTSAWMEDVVFTKVNDYYFDVVDYFYSFRDGANQSYSFATFNSPFFGYERSVWAHFLAKRFGRTVMTEIWRQIKTEPVLQSIKDVLLSHGSDFASEFSLFSYWNYFTADRADTVNYYPEGNKYPRFRANVTAFVAGSTETVATRSYALSTSMIEFQRTSDTVTVVVANADVEAAQQLDAATRSFSMKVTKDAVSGPHQILSNGFNAVFTATDPVQWRTFFSVSSSLSGRTATSELSPNPLRLGEAASLRLPVNDAPNAVAQVYLLSSSLDLVFSAEYVVKKEFGSQVIVVPASAFQSRISSGVYFVVAKTPDSEYRWKVAIIR